MATCPIRQLQPGATLTTRESRGQSPETWQRCASLYVAAVVGSNSVPQLFLHQENRKESFKFFLLSFEKDAIGNYFNSYFAFSFSFFSPFIEELVG